MTSKLPLLCLALLAGPALAHPGHDHAHWSAGWIHLGLALAVIAGVGLFALLRRMRQSD